MYALITTKKETRRRKQAAYENDYSLLNLIRPIVKKKIYIDFALQKNKRYIHIKILVDLFSSYLIFILQIQSTNTLNH